MYRLVLVLAIVLLGLLPVSRVGAQDAMAIDPVYNSYIIDDADFTNGFHITPARIQRFLDEQVSECEGDLCLKDYRDPDSGQTSAQIVHQAAQDFGLNPLVILTTLQKETSLVTDYNPEEWQYRTAMGYGCPDGADCDADFFGFANQVRLGANLLRAGFDRACGNQVAYFKWWVHSRWRQGNVVSINGRDTYIGNCATASLYNYTPHRVDSAWRDVEGAYYYGNYNFVILYSAWSEQI